MVMRLFTEEVVIFRRVPFSRVLGCGAFSVRNRGYCASRM